MNDKAFKPFRKYRALESTFDQIKGDKVMSAPIPHFAKILGYAGKRPDNRFRDALDPTSYEKRFNDKEWEMITDELFNIDTKYAKLFFNTYLSNLYQLNVVDDATVKALNHGLSTIEEVQIQSRSVIIEASDILRREAELLADDHMSEADGETLCKEADEAIFALKEYKLRVITAAKQNEE